ncbi:response regulator transcription factor [Clostridium estertheticum]|uniref:Response regulator transcription factor n=1 Tax=Clostridium estertheticum TaxID=238834 RepID=A0AA47EKC9_9CLOT|nr:response regulator transcription factor [Clostridium estertheticum]MBU3157560.1 response regulator transcription factor [Clostridium estertheticum]MBU3200837.1 response regulator transcription factor [Clostridium estertheticum]WAG61817.1 response regulator transcription factor [Clostridium estertheticum]WAG64062.1 response regulator transcription factor [Clostridium estertheticum]
MSRILIVEDDKNLNKGVAFALKKEGYEVISAYSILEGKNEMLNSKIDFLLLDLNLPDGNGLDFCKEIREKIDFPIVFFTANDTEEDTVKGFEVGADDYLAKPFSIEVLKYKINAILKRNKPANKNKFDCNNLIIDFDRILVTIEGKEVNLTVTEYKLLEILAKNKGKVITKDRLLDKVWDSNGNFVDENTLSVNIRRLRKKIEKDSKKPEYIITVVGIGYTFGE